MNLGCQIDAKSLIAARVVFYVWIALSLKERYSCSSERPICPAILPYTSAPERIRRAMGKYPITLVILARLAVDLDYQGQGLGFSLLQDAIRRAIAIAEQTGIRAVLTHPINEDAEAFYRRFGFEFTPAHERQLIVPSCHMVRASIAMYTY